MAAAAPPSPLLPREEEEQEEEEEEEYIDMDVSSSTFLYYTFTTAPPLSDDFEFHLSSRDTAANVSPADELFYKGKLLPLHLPPRLQMLERLLRGNPDTHGPPPVSPLGGHFVGRELPPREPAQPMVRRRWPSRLGFLRRCSTGLKVIMSRSFTTKSSIFRPPRPRSGDPEEEENGERRSISSAIRRYLPVAKQSQCSSSCSSSNCSPPSSSASSGSSNGTCTSPVMRRSSSVDSEEGSSIQRAIAYCKSTSQQRQKQQEIGSM